MMSASTTLQGLWESAGEILAAGGVTTPRREAIRIWSALARVSSAEAILARGQPIGADRAQHFLSAVARRAAGEPLAHVTGSTGFRHLEVACDRRALIPRPETEGLIDLALRAVRIGTAADIGTGSGVIALALASEGAFDRVVATDISPEALELARANGERLGIAVDWREGDLLAPLGGERVDLLVSNPPYLTDEELVDLDPSVAAWEPALALVSGADGLGATRRLLDEGRQAVVSGGWLALEVDCHRAPLVAALAESFGWCEVSIHDDLFGRARYCLARWGDGS